MAYTFNYTEDGTTKSMTVVQAVLDPTNETIHFVIDTVDEWGETERFEVDCPAASVTFDFATNEAAIEADAASALDEHFA
jgi:hypothetical protein